MGIGRTEPIGNKSDECTAFLRWRLAHIMESRPDSCVWYTAAVGSAPGRTARPEPASAHR